MILDTRYFVVFYFVLLFSNFCILNDVQFVFSIIARIIFIMQCFDCVVTYMCHKILSQKYHENLLFQTLNEFDGGQPNDSGCQQKKGYLKNHSLSKNNDTFSFLNESSRCTRTETKISSLQHHAHQSKIDFIENCWEKNLSNN